MIRTYRRTIILIFSLCSLSLLFTVSPAAAKKTDKRTTQNETSLYRELDLFTKVLSLIRSDYVEEPDEHEIITGAVHGMLSRLDPHSMYLTSDAYRELRVDTEGRFGGVGIEVALKNGVPTVVTAIEDSPAAKAGIQSGDRIVKIDNVSTKEMSLSDTVQKMRGSRKSKIHLTILREGMKEFLEIPLERDIIRLKSVRWESLPDDLGYVKISSFQENTDEDLRRALGDLGKKKSLRGLILDLRNNPGGLLDEAVDVCDEFLVDGTIVTTANRNHEIDRKTATKSGKEPAYPIVVMVNGGSASAAEIVAGALQDQKRATILGTTSFGKGTVQTIFDLEDGSALKLTVAKYFTPKGRSIQSQGIKPDVVIAAKKSSKKNARKSPESQPETQPEDRQKQAAVEYLKSGKIKK